MGKSAESKAVLGLTIATVLMFVVMLGIYGLNTLDTEIFVQSVGETSARYPTGITPASWAFSIWGFIFVWQAVWLIYALSNLCRTAKNGPVYDSPVILTPAFFAVYIVNLIAMICWVFFFDRILFIAAFIALAVIAITCLVCMILAYIPLQNHGGELLVEERTGDIWAHRILVHNGLGLYFGWTTVAALLNLIYVMSYVPETPLDLELSGTIILGILTGFLLVYFLMDLIAIDKYSRYTVTPYLAVIWALAGILDKHWDSTARNQIFCAVLISVTSLLLLVKVGIGALRHFIKPLYKEYIVATTMEDIRSSN